jgi:hypothetical protein
MTLPSVMTQHPERSLVLAAYADAEKSLPPRPKRAEPTGLAEPAAFASKVTKAEAADEPAGDAAPTDEAPAPEAEEDPRWIPRLGQVEGVPTELLSRVHGQLIAEGLLRFNLLGRMDGIGYRLTPAGRQALEVAAAPEAVKEPEPATVAA